MKTHWFSLKEAIRKSLIKNGRKRNVKSLREKVELFFLEVKW